MAPQQAGGDAMIRHWTNHEVKKLRELYPTASREELEAAFSRRTYRAIKDKAQAMGIFRSERPVQLGDVYRYLKMDIPRRPAFEALCAWADELGYTLKPKGAGE